MLHYGLGNDDGPAYEGYGPVDESSDTINPKDILIAYRQRIGAVRDSMIASMKDGSFGDKINRYTTDIISATSMLTPVPLGTPGMDIIQRIMNNMNQILAKLIAMPQDRTLWDGAALAINDLFSTSSDAVQHAPTTAPAAPADEGGRFPMMPSDSQKKEDAPNYLIWGGLAAAAYFLFFQKK